MSIEQQEEEDTAWLSKPLLSRAMDVVLAFALMFLLVLVNALWHGTHKKGPLGKRETPR